MEPEEKMSHVRLCLTLHNHQPVGNFSHVFEAAYQDSYLPFLDVFEGYESLKISLHTSGPLMEWLDIHHSDYLDRLAALVEAGRIEIIGGAFYEPILTMIPSRDRVGQITRYTRWLEDRLGGRVRGMWMPERVWEQGLASDLASAGIEYTLLDDFHFKNAGLNEEDLTGYYLTEDDGHVLRVFPGSEQLRYLIPFQPAGETVNYLRGLGDRHPGCVAVFGDDGEKFGTWPDTKQHVYDNGWLRSFFDALCENQEWLHTCTLSEAADETSALGNVYLPEGSYREMTEWALPVERQLEFDHLSHSLEHDDRWPTIKQFIRGGYWRNFKVKYPETNAMYSRMMMVSRRLHQTILSGTDNDLVNAAERELFRGQCNCSYWHGAFGGTYLPHLRNAIYNHLIAADNLLDKATAKSGPWVEATANDYNFDGKSEVMLANDKLIGLIAPAKGGQIYELDVRSICHNLLATLQRRPEAYHKKVQAGPSSDEGEVASIHDRVVFKQKNLDQRLQYDNEPRFGLIDRFFDDDVSLESVSRGEFNQHGSFVDCEFETKIRRNPNRVQVQMVNDGNVDGAPVRITKGVTLESGSSTLEIAYLLENLPQDRQFHFGIELNFAGMPGNADDRFFHRESGEQLGHLGTKLALGDVRDLALVDEWLGLDVKLNVNRPTHFWTYPVETVSQSEGGFEAVHQSVVVMPHWYFRADEQGRWTMTMQLNVDTSIAESRIHKASSEAEARV